jgi:hypothetical protein
MKTKTRRGVEGQSRSPHNRRGMRGKRDGATHSEWTAAAAAADRKARTLKRGNGCMMRKMHHATRGHVHL